MQNKSCLKNSKTGKLIAEIIIALMAVIVSALPYLHVKKIFLTATKDNSQKIAEEKAEEILTFMLDKAHFSVITSGVTALIDCRQLPAIKKHDPATIKLYESFKNKFFPNKSNDDLPVFFCTGEYKDDANRNYSIDMTCKDIFWRTSNPPSNSKEEVKFYLQEEPSVLSDASWMFRCALNPEDMSMPFTELDLPAGVSISPENVCDELKGSKIIQQFPDTKYGKDLCVMKKLTVQIKFQNDFGEKKLLHLTAIKGDTN